MFPNDEKRMKGPLFKSRAAQDHRWQTPLTPEIPSRSEAALGIGIAF
jgi:hypothetical protein